MLTATSSMHGLVGGLTRRIPAAGPALDPVRAAERVRAWREQRVGPLGLGPVDVDPVDVGSVFYRDDGSLSLRYHVRCADPPSREGGSEDGDDGVAEVPSTLLVSVSADGATVGLREFPDDPDLPGLPAATDPRTAADMLRATLPRLGLAPGPRTCRVAVVHHPRRGACVLRYDVTDAAGDAEARPSTLFAKVYGSASQARRVAAAATALGAAVASASRSALTLPEVLGVDPALAVLLLRAVPGTTPAAAAGVEAAARAAAALHRSPARADLPARARESALARLDAELDVVASVWPDLAKRVRVLSARGMGRGLATGCDPLVPCHGDLTPGQLLVTRDRVALVDLDSACLAEPASDVGRYLAYLDAALAKRPPVPAPTRSAPSGRRFLQTYVGAGQGDVPDTNAFLEQVRMYRSLNLALMALSAARRLKARRLSTALALLSEGVTP